MCLVGFCCFSDKGLEDSQIDECLKIKQQFYTTRGFVVIMLLKKGKEQKQKRI